MPEFDAIHVGLHKCASTYLQRVALNLHPEINLSRRDHKGLFEDFREYSFYFDRERWLSEVSTTEITAAKMTAKRNVFSSEGLSGSLYTGSGARSNFDRLHDQFPNLKIVLVLRNPYSYIYSAWNQYVQQGGRLRLRHFLTAAASPAWSGYRHSNIFRRVCYDRMVEYLLRLFGDDALLVLFFEDLRLDPERFLGDLYSFLDVDTGFRPPAAPVRF